MKHFGMLVALSEIDEGKGKRGIPFNGFGPQTNVEIPQGWLDVYWNEPKNFAAEISTSASLEFATTIRPN